VKELQQEFNIVDGEISESVFVVTRENLKRYYRDAANAWGTENSCPNISDYGTPIPGVDYGDFPLKDIYHRLDREYDPQECLEAMEMEELESKTITLTPRQWSALGVIFQDAYVAYYDNWKDPGDEDYMRIIRKLTDMRDILALIGIEDNGDIADLISKYQESAGTPL
jgi:hypothetical protein